MTDSTRKGTHHDPDLDKQTAEQHVAAVQQALNRSWDEIAPYLTAPHGLIVIEHLIGEVGGFIGRLEKIKRDITRQAVGMPLEEQLKRIEAEIRGSALRDWSDGIRGRDPDLPERR